MCGLAAIVLWSTTFALARSLSERVGPLTAGASVYVSGACFCAFGLWWSGGIAQAWRKIPRNYLWGCGSLFVLYTALIYLAVGRAWNREQLLEVALVNYLWPAATLIASLFLLGTRARVFLWPATLIALAGIFLVLTPGGRSSWNSIGAHVSDNPAPYAFAFAGAISWALYSNLARRWSRPDSQGGVAFFILATGVTLLALRYAAHEASSWKPQAILEALALGGITALAYWLWDFAMRKGDVLLVAAASYFTPLLSTFFSCAYLRVAPEPRVWLGCLLVVAGSIACWRSVSD